MLASLGKLPTGKEKEKTHQSPHYKRGQFQNPVPTVMLEPGYSYAKLIFEFLRKPPTCFPPKSLPSVRTNLMDLPDNNTSIVWFGHSSYLIKTGGKTVLVDPVFSGYVSPVKGMNKAFAGSNIYSVSDMPPIDFLLLTHDHYDHLDYETIIKLKPKVKQVCTSLGVASHLLYWGYSASIIHELDWYQSFTFESLALTSLPARHFSGRSLKRDQTLWSAFALETNGQKLLLGGDSGYASHLKEIGEKYGPFDLALLECGQYNLAWHSIHMLPEETAQASLDVKAKVLMPVHWGKFSLSLHPWDEPVKRVVAKADELKIALTTPMIGEVVVLNEVYPAKHWWEEW